MSQSDVSVPGEIQDVIDMINSIESVEEVNVTVMTGVDQSVIDEIEAAIGGDVGNIGEQMSCGEIEALLQGTDYDNIRDALKHLENV